MCTRAVCCRCVCVVCDRWPRGAGPSKGHGRNGFAGREIPGVSASCAGHGDRHQGVLRVEGQSGGVSGRSASRDCAHGSHVTPRRSFTKRANAGTQDQFQKNVGTPLHIALKHGGKTSKSWVDGKKRFINSSIAYNRCPQSDRE